MPANEPALAPSLPHLRWPRLRIIANGTPLAGAVSASIISNNHYAADRFRAQAAITPAEAAIWADTDSTFLDIQISLNGQPTGWTSLIQGETDHLQINPHARTLNLEGRDLTARLIETRTQETFANRTSSEIAILLAARHGLTPDVTQTTTPVGAYWQLEHDRITLDSFSRATTEWDLLVTLAGHEAFDVWVSGKTLHFRPPSSQPDPTTAGVKLRAAPTPSGPTNIQSLTLERALTLAGDIEVVVKSWNSRQASAFLQVARATRATQGPKQRPRRYIFVVPNLTPDAALKLAQSRLAELSRHERVITAEMPGELSLTPRQPIRLEGTQTSFDQLYWIDEITRRIDISTGFTQRLRARNSSQAVQATTPADTIGSTWTAS